TVDELADGDGGEVERCGAAVDPGEVEEVGDEVAQPFCLGQGGGEGVVARLHDAVDEVLQQQPLPGKGRAQLVGDGGDEVAALLVGGGEVDGHRVERAGEPAHLVGGGRGDPLGVVAGGHPRGGRGHLPERGGH